MDNLNQWREVRGVPRLEQLNDPREMEERQAGFDHIYDKVTRGKNKSKLFKEAPESKYEEEKEPPQDKLKKREAKERAKRSLHTTSTTNMDMVDFESELFKINIQSNSDPQGYALLYDQHLKGPHRAFGESTAGKYLRSFRSFVKLCAGFGLDLQNGYDEYLRYKLEVKKVEPQTINNVLASVKYFVNHVAHDDYAKSIK